MAKLCEIILFLCLLVIDNLIRIIEERFPELDTWSPINLPTQRWSIVSLIICSGLFGVRVGLVLTWSRSAKTCAKSISGHLVYKKMCESQQKYSKENSVKGKGAFVQRQRCRGLSRHLLFCQLHDSARKAPDLTKRGMFYN